MYGMIWEQIAFSPKLWIHDKQNAMQTHVNSPSKQISMIRNTKFYIQPQQSRQLVGNVHMKFEIEIPKQT